MNILFPYLARWRSANWSRYHQLLTLLCRKGHRVYVLEPPPLPSAQETNYTDLDVELPEGMVSPDEAKSQVQAELEKLD